MQYKAFVLTEDDKILGFKSRPRARGMAKALDFARYFDRENTGLLPQEWIFWKYRQLNNDAAPPFATRDAAEEWLFNVLPQVATPGELPPQGSNQAPASKSSPSQGARMATRKAAKKASKGTKRGKVATASKNGKGPSGRRLAYSGKTIHKLVKDNPRKEGTSGFESFSKIRNGMKYEDFVAAGGVRRDLEWDIAHKWVELKG